MLKQLALPLAVMTVLAGCTDDRGAPGPAPRDTAQSTCDSQLDQAFAAWARAGFSGSVAISTDGTLQCAAGYGRAVEATGAPNTAATVFAIGSVTKAFTAAAILDLADQGKLSLDDPVRRLLPELKGPVAAATVRQLLLHTSGLNGSHGQDYQPLTRAAAVAAIGRLRLAFKPGTGYVYSNAGYTLLALIVAQVSGMTYREYQSTRILKLPGGKVAGGFWNGEPAAPGPRALGYLDSGQTGEPGDFAGPHWAMEGNGGLAMTTSDLALWTHALFTGQVVTPASTKIISTPGHDLGDGRAETPGWVAHDRSVFGTPVLATAGGGGDVGHNAVVAWLPETRRVVAIASNRPEITAEALLKAVAPALVTSDPLPTPTLRQPGGGGDTAAMVGKYTLATGGAFDVTATGDRVSISATGADAVAALFPPRGVPASDVAAHEARVSALLSWRTTEGRAERKSLESTHGPIGGVALAGTLAHDGELRTYVTLTAGGRTILGWYAVNDEGGIEAAEVPTQPPALPLAPAGGARYRPDDPTGTGPDITVEFRADRLTIAGPAGTTDARRAR